MSEKDNKNSKEKQNLKEQNLEHETTGHKWDGISEYNIGAPRWWLIVWIISIIWSFGYWIFYPAWPTSDGYYTVGTLNWSQQSELKDSQKEINEIRSDLFDRIDKLSFAEIQKNEDLYQFALVGGRAAFKENCAACHGTGAQGFKGYPNLNDDDWLWGGKITDIYQTLLYGIRSNHDKARFSQMPSFGKDGILKEEEIETVAKYVMSLSGQEKSSKEGKNLFAQHCASCHGKDGKGQKDVGAPNLSDEIWLYGNDIKDITNTIYYSRYGVMPYWNSRLDNTTIKQLSLYVHSLGGGE
jgi:cytochrome c oxidase cbb3-type subunit 3